MKLLILQIADLEDLSTENEKKLGKLVKEKFGTDFYIMYRYPMEVEICSKAKNEAGSILNSPKAVPIYSLRICIVALVPQNPNLCTRVTILSKYCSTTSTVFASTDPALLHHA